MLLSPGGRSHAHRRPALAPLRRSAGPPRRSAGPVQAPDRPPPRPMRRRRPRVSVAVALDGPTAAIPRSFLGFSTEYWTLPVDENHIALYRRVMALLHTPRRRTVRPAHRRGLLRPLVLAAGRASNARMGVCDHAPVDRQDRADRPPEPVARDRRPQPRHGHPRADAALAREAVSALPRGSLAAFEIGNEPDVYSRQVWGVRLEGGRTATGLLPSSLTADSYAASFAADARSLRLRRPADSAPGSRARRSPAQPGLDLPPARRPAPATRRRQRAQYPYTACARPGAAAYPTIKSCSALQATTDGRRRHTRRQTRPRFALPVRVSEFNSVTCGGLAGVSDSFATALWAPSALFAFIRAGVSSADLHVRAYSINSPFGFDRAGVIPRPLLYGLILFTHMVGPGSRLARVRVHAGAGAPLRAWAVRQPGHRLSVLLIDRTARAARVVMRLPSRRRAAVERLVAPSPRATSGETLDGQWLGARPALGRAPTC